ncbi:hypothetical protein XENTR_v10020940 [Xenopus tropicalis]|nr:hypothetical protein XENTR_v10020940 [Xenopus tropicalis]
MCRIQLSVNVSHEIMYSMLQGVIYNVTHYKVAFTLSLFGYLAAVCVKQWCPGPFFYGVYGVNFSHLDLPLLQSRNTASMVLLFIYLYIYII